MFLAALGIAVQGVYVHSKKKRFPRSGFIEQKRIRKYFINKNKAPTEATPILINDDNRGGYGANNIC